MQNALPALPVGAAALVADAGWADPTRQDSRQPFGVGTIPNSFQVLFQ